MNINTVGKSPVAVADSSKAVGVGVLAREGQTRVLVAGSHRSGTTWLGEALGCCDDTAVITEPFSKDNGIIGVHHWFPYSEEGLPKYRALLDSFFLSRNRRFRPNTPGRSLLRSIGRFFLPDEPQLNYRRLMHSPPLRLIIKDPIASMAAEHLIRAFGFKVVFMAKHPFAFYDSLVRVGWEASLPLEDMWGQSDGPDGRLRAKQETDPARRAAIVWKIIYDNALALREKYPDNCSIIRHEDMCVSPEALVEQVAAFCLMPINAAMLEYVNRTTSSEIVSPERGVIHELSRASSELPRRWAASLDKLTQRTLLDASAGPLEILYPESSEYGG